MKHETRRRIEVVAAVIHDAEGRFLLAQRPPGKAYEGYWEFPGGKVEPGETAAQAIAREIHEELGITVDAACPWIMRDFDYEHALVRLRFMRIHAWRGEPQGREGQRFAWQSPRALSVAPMLPANAPILRALELPDVYAITRAESVGVPAFMRELGAALARGVRLIQVREKAMAPDVLAAFASTVVALARQHGARVLLNADAVLAKESGADGVHLTSAQLHALDKRPALDWVAASCHTREDIVAATRLGVDFAVLGPVMDTPTHPGAATLGWPGFSRCVADTTLPIYALGGLTTRDLPSAHAAGAHGVAMIRGAWAP